MFRLSAVLGLLLLGALAGWVQAAQERPASAEETAFFEKKIRPVLVQNCYKCHSAQSEKIKGGLVLDTRDGVRKGGETGPAVIPGDNNSLLLKAIRHQGELKMPAKKLADEVIADFERWVRNGAADPRDGAAQVVKQEIDVEKGRHYWAFQPPAKSAPPAVKATTWPRSDIDRFVLAGLEARGLKPVGDADPHTLIRRLYFDLIGLPPTPEEVEAFVKEWQAKPQAAFEAVVERLLASPHFGERWGRHWLDVVRFAESTGLQVNFAYPNAWRYRDYVIAAFNSDKPYDRFLKEQLAGDLLPADSDRQKAELLIATGFLAIGTKQLNERNRQQFLLDVADEQIDATFQAFQGLTAACARCHDHKFDPIPQKDYYALSGIFRSTETCYGTVQLIQNAQPASLLTLPSGAGVPVAVEPLPQEARERLQKQRDEAFKELRGMTMQERQNNLMKALRLRIEMQRAEARLSSFESNGTPKLQAMGVRDRFYTTDSKLYVRGELDKPGETVPRGFPQVLTTQQPVVKDGSGRRELAEFLASRDNPLTARVMVNRIWLHLLGRGIVVTPDNFGAAGQKPSNQALLDSLAVSFMDNGWSIKKTIRQIVLSRVYQLGSNRDPASYEIDPDNALAWRQSRRRLDAEAVRDSILAVSGQLDTKPPLGSVVARVGEGPAGFARFLLADSNRIRARSVYLPVIRDQVPEALALFDFAEPSLVTGERASTTIPAQALFLLNSPAGAAAGGSGRRPAAGPQRQRPRADSLRLSPVLWPAGSRARGRAGPAVFEPVRQDARCGGQGKPAGRLDGAVPGVLRQRGLFVSELAPKGRNRIAQGIALGGSSHVPDHFPASAAEDVRLRFWLPGLCRPGRAGRREGPQPAGP